MSIHNLPSEHSQASFPEPSADVVVLHRTKTGVLNAYGNTVPTDATAGYHPGCLFQHTDGVDESTVLYCNISTVLSCDFNVVTVAS